MELVTTQYNFYRRCYL